VRPSNRKGSKRVTTTSIRKRATNKKRTRKMENSTSGRWKGKKNVHLLSKNLIMSMPSTFLFLAFVQEVVLH